MRKTNEVYCALSTYLNALVGEKRCKVLKATSDGGGKAVEGTVEVIRGRRCVPHDDIVKGIDPVIGLGECCDDALEATFGRTLIMRTVESKKTSFRFRDRLQSEYVCVCGVRV